MLPVKKMSVSECKNGVERSGTEFLHHSGLQKTAPLYLRFQNF